MSRTANKAPGPSKHSPHSRQEEEQVPQMLMSPPPEETLRIARGKAASEARASPSGPYRHSEGDEDSPSNASKRKRNRTISSLADTPSASAPKDAVASSSRITLEATPNPKPRKQSKLHVSFVAEPTTPTKSSAKSPRSRASASPSKKSLLQSPHAQNPLADYAPPGSPTKERASSRRRSTTPLPHYEPPPERFTPPREVVYSPAPSISKSSKRKSVPRSNAKSRRLTLQIKKEPPEIDLNAPLPPPSPTDDPLLLHGPPPSTRRRPTAPRASLASTHSRDTPPISSSPVRPSQAEASYLPVPDFAAMDVDSSDDEPPLPPLFAFDKPRAADEPWTDEEADDADASEFDHAGEYTGRFKVIAVPTKADPPSSTTRRRQDKWGRPISPFPRARLLPALRHSPIPESPAREEDELPIAEYEDEEPGKARPPTPPRPSDPLPEEVGDDVYMDEPADELPPSAVEAPSVPAEPPTAQDDEPAVDEEDVPVDEEPPFADEGDAHSEAISVESVVEYSVRIPSERESPDPGVAHEGEVSRVEETVFTTAEDSVDSESVLSYVEPGDLLKEAVPADYPERTDEGAAQNDVSATIVIPAQDEVRHEPSLPAVQQPDLSPDAATLMLPTPRPTVDTHPTEHIRSSQVSVPPALEPVPTDVPDNAQAEWSFGVPQTPGGEDEEMATAEEEDAWSVIRELSREPDEPVKLDAQSRPAPPPLPTPKLPLSPRNPFHVRTPGVASVSAARQPDTADGYRSLNATLPQFDLPEDDFDESLLDPGIVKITSSDPMAAARAAAILRLHKYDCVQHVPSPKHRTPFDLESTMRSANRRSLMQSAVGKSSTSLRRSTLGGVLGNTVVIDGSPRTTLAELLKEAEATVIMEESSLHGLTPPRPSASLKTPARSVSKFEAIRSTFETPATGSAGPREWSKADWKALDSCYTDERLACGDGELAPAHEVDLEKVVDRFVVKVGERVLAGSGPAWSRDNLLKRARALQRKQMSATQATSSSMLDTSAMHSWTTSQQYSTLLSPNTSILRDLDPPSQEASTASASARSSQTSGETSTSTTDTAPTSSAGDVQYSQLLEDAIAVERGDSASYASRGVELSPPQLDANRSFVSPLQPGRAAHSLASKVKGLIFSYLPRSPRTAPAKSKPAPAANGPVLPVPPPELFKKPRPPIATPAPKQPAKPALPKVQLNRVPPPKSSMIPRPASQPQRWVQLNPVSSRPSSSTSFNATALRERRDSGASVKDLVKTFETMEKMQTVERELELRRKKSVKQWAEGRAAKTGKPTWRP